MVVPNRFRRALYTILAIGVIGSVASATSYFSVKGSPAYLAAKDWATTSSEVGDAIGGAPLSVDLSWNRFDSKSSAEGTWQQFALNVASSYKKGLVVVRVDNYSGGWRVRSADFVTKGRVMAILPPSKN